VTSTIRDGFTLPNEAHGESLPYLLPKVDDRSDPLGDGRVTGPPFQYKRTPFHAPWQMMSHVD
jgi:hypothetical protein